MKKSFLIFLGLIVAIQIFAQTNNTTKKFPASPIEKIRLGNLIAASQLSALKADYISISEDLSAFNKYIDTLSAKDSPIYTHRDMIKKIYTAINAMGLNGVKYMAKIDRSRTPCPLVLSYNGSEVYILNTVIYPSILNKNRFDEKQRASQAMNMILKIIQQTAEKISNDVKYVGFGICYGAKDFSDKYASNEFDYMLVITPTSTCKNFSNAAITDVETIKNSAIFCQTYDNMNLMKIEL